ncbi:head-tail connector protein [Proteus sp. G2665]|uniref:head-tail connector protein n=1 Tax=Proteus sp. G2665 TaxID=2698878 RepID=UPI000197DB44|nr:head-tail connector protein [Proteus sp. G2665]EEG85581.1 putative phage DNA packaging protein [Proteus penneri ATCC 35198]NBN02674.1 phage gp6-like head-tail connector protein [Proteus sp. G2665]
MPLPTLEKLKQQCRLDEGDTLEDELLKTYLMAAKQRAEGYINRHLYEKDIPEEDPDGLLITDDIELALMLAVGNFYENRETAILSAGFKLLLDPYRHINL